MVHMARKMQPAALTLNFDIGAKQMNYIDLAKVASEVNRRFYRQGMNYAVGGFRFGYIGNESPTVVVRQLPTTWSVGASWHKFFAAWQRQQKEAIENTSTEVVARYNDFKIWADAYHKSIEASGSLSALNPGGFITGGGSPYKAGDWMYSQIVVPNDPTTGTAAEYSCHMVGPDVSGSKGMIVNYGLSRNLPFSPDPNTPINIEDSVLSEMFDVGEIFDEVVDNVTERNDSPPYDVDEYPDAGSNPATGALITHREIQFTSTTIGNFQNMDGGMFPCGLIQVTTDLSSPTDNQNSWLTMQVMMVPGNYKGYLAQPMQEMN